MIHRKSERLLLPNINTILCTPPYVTVSKLEEEYVQKCLIMLLYQEGVRQFGCVPTMNEFVKGVPAGYSLPCDHDVA